MFVVGLALTAVGYALAYYGANILHDAYILHNAAMNPAPLFVLLGLPGTDTATGLATPAAQQSVTGQ